MSREKFEQAIKARFADLIDYHICKNGDGEYMAWDMQVAWFAWQAATASMQAERDQLAAECAALTKIVDFVTDLDNEPQYHDDGMGCGLEDRSISSIYDAARYGWDEAMERIYGEVIPCADEIETPATDRFLAELRASAIPEGYVLVPQKIFLDPSDIESICSQCGDGHESGYGDFTDGLLWVGNIQRDDGSIVHGLHISSADYTEEGGVTVCEFAAQLRNEVKV